MSSWSSKLDTVNYNSPCETSAAMGRRGLKRNLNGITYIRIKRAHMVLFAAAAAGAAPGGTETNA